MKYQHRRIDRLAKREEKETIKRIITLSIVSFILAGALFVFGTSVLGKLVDVLGLVFKGKSADTTVPLILSPPILDDLPQATNSAKLTVSGFANNGNAADIYLNGNKVKEVDINNNKFSAADITLSNGANNISVRVIGNSGNESDFSLVKIVNFSNKEPNLTVGNPSDGASVSGDNHVRVSGSTDKDNQVYANGFLASVGPDGKFEVSVPLIDGDNTIEIKAIDSAGNTKTVVRKVHFSK